MREFEALEMAKLGERLELLESKGVEGMTKLNAIQLKIKQNMVNQQARYELFNCQLPDILSNPLTFCSVI